MRIPRACSDFRFDFLPQVFLGACVDFWLFKLLKKIKYNELFFIQSSNIKVVKHIEALNGKNSKVQTSSSSIRLFRKKRAWIFCCIEKCYLSIKIFCNFLWKCNIVILTVLCIIWTTLRYQNSDTYRTKFCAAVRLDFTLK